MKQVNGIVNKWLCRVGLVLLMCSFAGSADAAVARCLRVVEPGGLEAIQRAIDSVAAAGGGTVRVPKGTWETKPIFLKSHVTLALDEGALVLGSTNFVDYARTDGVCPALVSAQDAENVAVIGPGATFDGRGDGFFEKYASGASQPKKTPMMMKFVRCRNVRLSGFTYRRSGSWGIHLMNCDGVTVKGLTCVNHVNQCNDGIDIESRNVLIEDCNIDSDDDSICFKAESDKNFVIENVTVRNCRLASCCNFIKFGTGSYKEWRNILVENCTFHRASASHRFTWYKWGVPGVTAKITGLAGIALELVDGGRMRNVTVRNITIEDGVITPLFVRLGRRHANADGGGSFFENVVVENVRMLKPADSRIASSITGLPGMRLSGLTVRNCDFLFPGGGTNAEAGDLAVPENPTAYPECTMFRKGRGSMALPAYGLYMRHADGVKLENVKLRLAAPDARVDIFFEDVLFHPETGAGAVTRASLQRAIDAAAARGGGKVTVPAGWHFMEGPLHLRSNVALALADGAELVFTDDPKAYLPAVDTTWEAVECRNYSPLIYAYGCTNIALTGKGTLRPKMDLWRTWFARPPAHMAFTRLLYEWGSHDTPLAERDATKIPGSNARPHFVQFNRCKGVRLENFRIRESPFWCVHLYQCEDCTVRGLDIRAHGHNNDGIDIDMTRNVLIENCTLDQGDDAFVVKSGRNRDGWRLNRPTENVEIRNCRVIHGHTLLGVGSDLSAGIRNVRIRDCTVEDTVFRAFYIKTSRRRGGEIFDIVMENCRVKATTDALVAIDTDVLYQFRNLPTCDERLTDIHDITIRNVTCERTPHLVRLAGDAACPVRDILIEGVTAQKVTKKPVVLANCTRVSVNGKGVGVGRSDFGSILARPVLPQTAWMSSDRVSRQPFGDVAGFTRREVSVASADSLRVERVAYAHANGLELPAVVIVPPAATGEPVVITGQSNRMHRNEYLGWALGGKRPVIALDLFGTGEIAGCLENGKDADTEATLAARLKARGESLETIRAAELVFVLGEAKRRFGKPATVLAGSATYTAAERAAREHPELVGRLIRAQGEKTLLPQ